jgi:hypothetical protein
MIYLKIISLKLKLLFKTLDGIHLKQSLREEPPNLNEINIIIL